MLTAADRVEIEEAVTRAEAGTSGEIICVLASEVSRYREVPFAWASAAALALPPLAFALGLRPLAAFAGGLWAQGEADAMEMEISVALWLYAALQILIYIVVYLIVSIPAVRRALTPGWLRRHRVARAARRQFVSISARATGSETGVMIFVAEDDHAVEILADDRLHAKVGESVWTSAVEAVTRAMKDGADPTRGIIRAVEMCGEVLRRHFPSSEPHQALFTNKPLDV
jgi:putative membrane protein